MNNRIISILLVSILCMLCFSGCIKDPQETALAIIVGNHSNSKIFDIQVEDKLKDIYSGYGNICVVTVDGNPEVLRDENNKIVGEYEDDLRNVRNNESYWQKNYLEPRVEEVKKEIEKSLSDDPEVDTLEALIVASNQLNSIVGLSTNKDINKEIIIYDTGLCTDGALSFLEGTQYSLLNDNIGISTDNENDNQKSEHLNDLITYLDSNNEIPDLSDVTVTWYGLGEVGEPQQSLSHLEENNLKSIWGEVLKKAQAIPSKINGSDSEYGFFVPANGYNKISNYQPVTPIVFSDDVVETTVKVTSETTDKSDVIEVKFTEEKIGFKPNAAILESEEDVKEILKPYADKLKKSPNIEVLLVGTTSSWNGGSISISEDRANKIKEILIQLGISENRIKTIGLGYNLILCENDTPNGKFLETIGKENRAVNLLTMNSEKAKKILNSK